jgi:hypothetical protein
MPGSEQNQNICVVRKTLLEASMSAKQSTRKVKSSDMRKREEANLGQKEAWLEKEKSSELTGEKSLKSEKNKMKKD